MADTVYSHPTGPEAVRLTFEWSKGKIKLSEAQRVGKRAPASDLPHHPPTKKSSASVDTEGIWLELIDGDRFIWSRQVTPMFPDSHEVQTGNPKQPLSRIPRTQPYQIDILVPYPRQGSTRIVLSERSTDTGAKRGSPMRYVVHVDVTIAKVMREELAQTRGEN